MAVNSYQVQYDVPNSGATKQLKCDIMMKFTEETIFCQLQMAEEIMLTSLLGYHEKIIPLTGKGGGGILSNKRSCAITSDTL